MHNKQFPAQPISTETYSVSLESKSERIRRKHEPVHTKFDKIEYMYNIYVYDIPVVGKMKVMQRSEAEAFAMLAKQMPTLAQALKMANIRPTVDNSSYPKGKKHPSIWRVK